MAEINETMYKKTPVGTATINGYPTVILLKKGTPHTEIQDAKNVTMMNKLVSSTPEEVERDLPSPNIQPMNTVTENVEEPVQELSVQEQEEPVPSLASEVNRSEQSAEIVRNSEAGVTIPMVEESQENTIGTPPNASDDLIRNTGEMLTPGPNATMVENISSNTGSNNERPKMGGGLYASLLKAAAPAVILTGAVAMTKRRRRKTRSKRRV